MADIIEDFSFPLQPFSGPLVGVFWDVEDYSFPEEDRDNPDLIYEKIIKLVKAGPVEAGAKISIWAYVDETDEYWKDKLVKKTWKHSIYFLPRGDKMTGRMFHDILFWSKDTPEVAGPDGFYYERHLMVISNQPFQDKGFFDKLGVLNDSLGRYIVSIKLPHREPDQLPWPESVFKRVYLYCDEAFGMGCESEQGSSTKPMLLPEGSNAQG